MPKISEMTLQGYRGFRDTHLTLQPLTVDIAYHYGVRLGANPYLVLHLTTNYPSHGFVIDFKEVNDLFSNARVYNDVEKFAEPQIQHMLEQSVGYECIRYPYDESIVILLDISKQDEQYAHNDHDESNGDEVTS